MGSACKRSLHLRIQKASNISEREIDERSGISGGSIILGGHSPLKNGGHRCLRVEEFVIGRFMECSGSIRFELFARF